MSVIGMAKVGRLRLAKSEAHCWKVNGRKAKGKDNNDVRHGGGGLKERGGADAKKYWKL